MAGQKVAEDNVSEYAASALSDRISAVAQRVEAEIPLREALASRLDKLEGRLDDADARIRSLGQEITRYVRANRDQAERIEKLERDLRDTHDLAERVATAHLERKPDGRNWHGLLGEEPPRDQTYVDGSGYLWRFEEYKGWRFRAQYEDTWTSGVHDGEGGWIWGQLVDGRATAAGVDPQFPWKVWADDAQ